MTLPNLWRLNVRHSQIEECIRTSLFAFDRRTRNPEMAPGDYLLLQLVKQDATKLGKTGARIEFALVFERLVRDHDGSRSRAHWPHAGKTWRYIVECSETVPTAPFSLGTLGLGREYGGRSNPQLIEPADAALVWPWIRVGERLPVVGRTTDDLLLRIARNWDRVVEEGPVRTTRVREHERRIANPLIHDILKHLYEFRCQICLHDFRPRYGVPFAETRLLNPIDKGGMAISRNVVVVCPNHNAIIGVTKAEFDHISTAFRYPNGLVEPLKIDRHVAA